MPPRNRAANVAAPELEPGVDAPPSYTEARAAYMQSAADLRRLEVRKKQSELVERRAVERRVAYWARRLQDTLARWPARMGAELAAVLGVDEPKLTRALEAHVRKLARELAGERFDLDG